MPPLRIGWIKTVNCLDRFMRVPLVTLVRAHYFWIFSYSTTISNKPSVAEPVSAVVTYRPGVIKFLFEAWRCSSLGKTHTGGLRRNGHPRLGRLSIGSLECSSSAAAAHVNSTCRNVVSNFFGDAVNSKVFESSALRALAYWE
jgi:hypothetical protein